MKILTLIRWQNLVLIALAQLLLKYALLEPFGVQTALDGWGICLLILATLCIAAAGNIINDIYDTEADAINKPHKHIVGTVISETTANYLYIALNMIGVGIGFYVSLRVGKSAFFSLFVVISALLYIYSSYLKGIIGIGNLVISLLVASSLYIVGIFELIPTLTPSNKNIQLTFFKIIRNYAIFAFMINLLREIIKDIEDVEGDKTMGIVTLPIYFGIRNSTILLFCLHTIVLFILCVFTITELYTQQFALLYFLVLLIGPMLYSALKLLQLKTKADYKHISTVYKWVMLFGVLSLLRFKLML